MLKRGEVNNCERCGSQYGKYDDNPDSNWSEHWAEQPILIDVEYGQNNGCPAMVGKIKPAKGLCQFCNSKSKYFNK